MAKRPVPRYDFKAFGAAIKAAREGCKESRKKVGDEMFISPRYLANIENKGLLCGVTENAVRFPLQRGKVKELWRGCGFLLSGKGNAYRLSRFASPFQRVGFCLVRNPFACRVRAG